MTEYLIGRGAGLPDFFCTKYQNGKNTPQNILNGHKIFPIAVKYTEWL
jgi:hypothetical protein